MKKLYSLIFALLIAATLMGQAPESFKYQAVLRNARGDLKASTATVIGIEILKGSTTGIKVYSETHNVTTDSYGLINLEIGKGTSTLGTFSDVDWSAGSYYIKLIVDGTAMGTSQLLSVPYALYAKSSGTVLPNLDLSGAATGDILQYNGTKWVKFTPNYATPSHTHSDATITVSGFLSGTDKTRLDGLQNADGAETKVTAGTNITVTGTGTPTTPYVINSTGGGAGFTHYIGELFGGGIVVSVWKVSGVEHGLIASLVDLSAGIIWTTAAYQLISVPGGALSPIDGLANSNAIVAQAGAGSTYAAGLCRAYSAIGDGGLSDWYLPAPWEINQCFNAALVVNTILGATNGFQFAYYWSSTEYYSNAAWGQSFIYGGTANTSKLDTYSVRAVRRF